MPGAVGTGIVIVADDALDALFPLQLTAFTVTVEEATTLVQVTVILFVVIEVTPEAFTVTPLGFVTIVPIGNDQM